MRHFDLIFLESIQTLTIQRRCQQTSICCCSSKARSQSTLSSMQREIHYSIQRRGGGGGGGVINSIFCVWLDSVYLLPPHRVSPSLGSRQLLGQRVDFDWRPVLHHKEISKSIELRGVGEAATLAVGVLELELKLELPSENEDGRNQTRLIYIFFRVNIFFSIYIYMCVCDVLVPAIPLFF